ncbi:SRPBCC family protein [Kribbia dieselivorans]|uniref:SRPBCC family protein n=1 Tax=Kribbia dieselivorans TaxID=331526 RepID=UPI00146FCBE6|nr:SRPBCC family protein [Kribbia dieselivorans]
MGATVSFAEDWQLSAPSDAVVAVLAAVDAYDQWWPQIRRIERIDEASGWAYVRSVMPVTLRLRLTRETEDRAAGLLRVRLDGDLVGWCQWCVEPSGGGSVATFTEEVSVKHPVLRRFVGVPGGDWMMRANHAAMMRSGRAGLRRWLGPDTPTGSR